jgi:hypothetical protein
MSQEVVAAVKQELQQRGVDLSGPDGAFKITSRVAWRLRANGVGLLEKSSGNNSRGFAVDIVCFRDGRQVDMLRDGGGENGPQWNVLEFVTPDRWRAPLDPQDEQPSGQTPTPGHPTTVDLSAVVAAVREGQTSQEAIRTALVEFRTEVDRRLSAIEVTLREVGPTLIEALRRTGGPV